MATGSRMKKITHAIITGKIATIKDGKRVINEYQSGDKLIGIIPIDDTPKYTGYVRGYNKHGKVPQF